MSENFAQPRSVRKQIISRDFTVIFSYLTVKLWDLDANQVLHLYACLFTIEEISTEMLPWNYLQKNPGKLHYDGDKMTEAMMTGERQ